jgi:iron complex transport system substrate-binding protein
MTGTGTGTGTGAGMRRRGEAGGISSWALPGVVVLVLAAVLLWTDADAPDARGAAEPVAVDGSFPRDVVLPDGGVLHLDVAPVAILPAASGSVDLVCALVPPERVAALPDLALRYSGLRDPDSPYLARPRFDVYEAERVLSVAPDLVLAHPWQSPDTTARLREAGVEVVVLPDPVDWAGVVEQVGQVGELLGAEQAADDLLARCDAKLRSIRSEAADRPGWTALAYSYGGAGGLVAGAGTTNDEIFRLAGLTNISPRAGHTALTFEELLVLDPDVLVIGGQADKQQAGGTLAVLRSEPALAGLRAVVEDRIVVLDSWLYTTLSHHLLDAAEEVLVQSADWAPRSRTRR